MRNTRQYQHHLDAFVDPQRTPQAAATYQRRASFSHTPRQLTPSRQRQLSTRQTTNTPTPTRRASFATNQQPRANALRVAIRDVTAIVNVDIQVDGFTYDSSIMEHPEFRIRTMVVFQCTQFGTQHVETSWRVHRTFQEFQGLDLQLRQKFPFDMCEIAPPKLHRRRTFFRMHRTKSFLHKRAQELQLYLAEVLDASTMRLTRFMDPRAPLILRCFCNFDIGFGKKLRLRPIQLDACVLCIDTHHHHLPNAQRHPSEPMPLTPPAPADDEDPADREFCQQQEQEMLRRWRLQSSHSSHHEVSRHARSRTDSKFDELEANLLEDRARNMAMCQRVDCSCQHMSFRLTEGKMARILRLRGLKPSFRPSQHDGPSALFCVLYRLQQYNELDRKLHEIMSEYSASKTESNCTASDEEGDDKDVQLAAGVDRLRDALTNYGLIYVHALAPHFRTTVVEMKKKIHEFKSRQRQRTGALELVLLCSMLDLSIVLVTNDHEGTVQEIFPLPELQSLRRGGRIVLTMGYILPTMVCVDGLYVLADELKTECQDESSRLDPKLWQGLEELDRSLIALIDTEVLQSELRRIEAFDDSLAEPLNRALLDAVWDDCQHNPHHFHVFQRHARQFGKSRITAAAFFQYLEIAFGLEGATYLVDFLLHVLPEANLRKQLLRARWRHIQRQLTKRVAAVAC